MDIAKVVDYEATYKLEIVHPVTDEPTGIVFELRSAESDHSKAVLRRHLDEIYDKTARGKKLKGADSVRQELEKAAACIVSWDWGKNTWEGKVPELSMKTAIDVLDKAGWIFGQVSEASKRLANFSKPSEVHSRSKSA